MPYHLIALLLLLLSISSFANRNIILFIGDGMDDQQITIARNYLKGSKGTLVLDSLPVRAVAQVQTVSDSDPSKPVYVADSANSASTMATGVLTSRSRLSTAAKTNDNLTTIIEYAKRTGYKTGIVSTASITDATPAAFIAHIDNRFCESPDILISGKAYGKFEVDCSAFSKANGRGGMVSEQLVESEVDILLGGGFKHFNVTAEDGHQTLLERAKQNNYEVITNKQSLTNINTDKKLLGLFSSSTMPTKLQGEGGRIAEKPKRSFLNKIYKYMGDVTLPEPMRCEPNPNFISVPELQVLTQAAINHLDKDESSKGFFLMIESASIDKQSHQRNPCGSIGELEQLDQSLAVALNFTNQSPNTLVLVTADHGQAAQLIPETSMFRDPNFGDLPIASNGAVARLITDEGAIMGINYATNKGYAEEHTGVNVPLFANSEGAGLISPYVTQADIFHIMMNYLGINQ